jgi:glycine cleavage system H protein
MEEKPFEIKVDKWTFRVPRDLLYNENDCYVKIGGNTAKVGITDFLQNMAGDIIFVDVKEVGTEIEQFDEAASFESIKTVLDLISPVSGTITEANEQLSENPELVNQDPYGDGWFAKIKLKNFEVDRENLLDANGYFQVLKKKIEQERKKLGKQR